MVADNRNDVRVARDDPELVPRVPVDGVDLAQPSEERVRVPDRVVGEQVVEIGVVEGLWHSDVGLDNGDWGLGTGPGCS